MTEATLRPWRPSDAFALVQARNASEDLDAQFGGTVFTDVGAAERFIADSLVFEGHARNWAVDVDGEAVGNIGLSAIEYRNDTAWTYYWLAAPVRGCGIAGAGLRAVAGWAFTAGLHRLELGHRTNNPASCRVATAAGFVPEGVERDKLRYGDERFDVELHARLRTDPSPAGKRLPLKSR